MNNTIRFLIGLVLLPIIFLSVAFLLILLFPILLTFGLLFFTIVALVGIIGILVFLYYLTRKEPSVKKTTHSNNYSIKSGKRK
jgi:hypothetical protein